jgi:hypothetical protein
MKTFKVTITETLKREIYVEAKDYEEAERIAEYQYYHGDHVLDSEDYETTTFEAEEDE